jgi:hypothetical protein
VLKQGFGLREEKKLRKLVSNIGGITVCENAIDSLTGVADFTGITFVITNGTLKRTPKLMIALNMGARYVVGAEWLYDSAKQTPPRPLDINKTTGSSYLITDNEREELWSFSLVNTLARNRVQVSEERLFHGLSVYFSSDVFQNFKLSEVKTKLTEMRLIVESGGGKFVVSVLPSCRVDT